MMYYRILNPTEEPKGQILTSNRKSQFREDVFAYRKLSHDIYVLAMKTGLKIYNAVRVAENVPAFIDELNEFIMSDKTEYDLSQMLIDDPVRYISRNNICDFAHAYIEEINETGLYYDWGHEHYLWEFIWEMVRYSEFSNMPSRMDSVFLFDNQDNANEFKNKCRTPNYRIAKINLLEGSSQSFDMNWFSEVPSDIPLSEVLVYVRNYWTQKMTQNPIVEILFQGKYMWDK